MKVIAQTGVVFFILEEVDGISRHKNGLAFTPEMAARVGADLITAAAKASLYAAAEIKAKTSQTLSKSLEKP